MKNAMWKNSAMERRGFRRRLGRPDHHGGGRGRPGAAVAGKARRGRAGGSLGQSHRPAGSGDRGPEPALVRGQYRASDHGCPAAGVPSGAELDGGDPGRPGGRAAMRCSKPSSCCRGRSRKRGRLRNTCRSCSTICGWWRPGPRCSRSSPGAANGSRSSPMPTRSISTSLSPRSGSSGAVSRAARNPSSSALSRRSRGSRPSALSI